MSGETPLTWGQGLGKDCSEAGARGDLKDMGGGSHLMKSGERGQGLEGPRQEGASCAPGELESGN